jgi:hypothetical protein
MAERRMFAKTIIDSDAFLDMPTSTQAFYFHLGMRADDDGFINNPKKIQKIVGGNDDDFKLLIAKRFIIPFESGVVVIKHWKIHNYIQSDRYKPTLYQEEKRQLVTKDNKGYTVLETVDNSTMYPECVQVGDTGKVRLGKDRLGKDNKDRKKPDPIPYQEIVDMYNEICVDAIKCIKLTDSRKKQIALRYKELGDIELFEKAFHLVQGSSFLTGKNDRNWKVDIPWLIQNDSNIIKVLEGKYKNDKPSVQNERKTRVVQESDDEWLI